MRPRLFADLFAFTDFTGKKEGKPLITRDIFIILNILYPHTFILLFSL